MLEWILYSDMTFIIVVLKIIVKMVDKMIKRIYYIGKQHFLWNAGITFQFLSKTLVKCVFHFNWIEQNYNALKDINKNSQRKMNLTLIIKYLQLTVLAINQGSAISHWSVKFTFNSCHQSIRLIVKVFDWSGG